MFRSRRSPAPFLQHLPHWAAFLLLAGTLQACGDDITGPADLEPNRFKATLIGGIEGSADGFAHDGIGSLRGERFRMILLKGLFPDGEQHEIGIIFDALTRSSGTYSVAPDWRPGVALGPEEVAIYFTDATRTATHIGTSGTLALGAAQGLEGELTVTFAPLDAGAGQEIEADIIFRVEWILSAPPWSSPRDTTETWYAIALHRRQPGSLP